MKTQKNLLLLAICMLMSALAAQAQNAQKGFNFQGYARDFNGAAYSSADITVKFSVYPEGEGVEYSEEISTKTDAYGVFAAVIGSDRPVDFETIDFSSKNYFVKVEVKVTGGDYVEITDTEFLAVPYAKSAQTAVKANNGVPPGTILPFGGPLANIPDGYLACDGSLVAEADYPELYAAIESSWGGDATNFRVPDLGGQFLRGRDGDAEVDPDDDTRTAKYSGGNTGDAVGSYQGYAIQDHAHSMNQGQAGPAGNSAAISTDQIANNAQTNGPIGGNVSSETRPVNAYVLFIIKY